MLKNYIKITFRNLWKDRLYSFINIAGLTIGLVTGMLILLWAQDELSFDRFHKKTDNIYRVVSHADYGTNVQVSWSTPAPVARRALSEVPGVKNAVRIYETGNYSFFKYKDEEYVEDKLAYTDPALFEIFDFELIKGDSKNPFPDNNSVIITVSTAKRYFGKEDPIGKTLLADNESTFVVSGVVEDFPKNSSIRYDILFPMSLRAMEYTKDSYWKSLDADWGNWGYRTFLEV